MITYIKNLPGSVALVIFLLTVSHAVYAGASLSDPMEKDVPAKKRATAIGTAVTGAGNVTPIVKPGEAPQRMSCWQYGKLIFEQAVIAPDIKVTDARVFQNPETGEKMLAFDYINAFCFIK